MSEFFSDQLHFVKVADGQGGQTGSATVFAYAISPDTPNKPTNGQAPGLPWILNDPVTPTSGTYTWMTSTTRTAAGVYGNWTEPIRITGEQGEIGADGKGLEFIYYLSNSTTPPGPPTGIGNGWTQDPVSVSLDNPYLYASIRTSDDKGVWTAFGNPFLWAKYGMDGQGVSYIYKTTETVDPPDRPTSSGPGRPLDWTDEPQGTTSTNILEWVSVSKYSDSEGWTQYSPPKIYTRFVKDGVGGDTTVFAYQKTALAASAPAKPANGAAASSPWVMDEPVIPSSGEVVWMTSTTKTAAGVYGTWTTPIRVTGDKGEVGEDGDGVEFVYFLSNSGTAPTQRPTKSGTTLSPAGWKDDPTGVTRAEPYEYVSYRTGHTGNWSTFSLPKLWAKYGTDGVGVSYVYKRTATDTPAPTISGNGPAAPTAQGWTDEPAGPTKDNQVEWISISNYENEAWGAFSTPKIYARYSPSGTSNAVIFLYKRADQAPQKPTTESTYTFSTNTLSGHDNSWTQSVPAVSGKTPLWMIQAVASATAPANTDTIPQSEWSAPIKMVESGADGLAGYNQATIQLYQRKSGTAPVVDVADPITYQFVDGTITGSLGSWTRSVPTGTAPLYVIYAVAISRDQTDTIPKTEWSAPVVMAKDGETGPAGPAGTGIASTTIDYQKSNSGTTQPETGWATSPSQTVSGEFLWTRTVIAYTDSSSTTSYSVAGHGAEGAASVVYSIEPNVKEVVRNLIDPVIAPASLVFSAYKTTGNGTPVQYSGGKIEIHYLNSFDQWVAEGSATTGASRTLSLTNYKRGGTRGGVDVVRGRLTTAGGAFLAEVSVSFTLGKDLLELAKVDQGRVYVDGGALYAGSVATDALTANAVTAGKIQAEAIDVSKLTFNSNSAIYTDSQTKSKLYIKAENLDINANGSLAINSGASFSVKNTANNNVILANKDGITIGSGGILNLQSAGSIKIGGSPLSVGGTNLVRNSRNLTALSPWVSVTTPAEVVNNSTLFYNDLGQIRIPSASATEYLHQPLNTNTFKAGDQYTVSFWAYGSASIVVRVGDTYTSNVLFDTGVITPKYSLSGTSGSYYEATATISSETAAAPRFYVRFSGASGNLHITRIQLEKGTMATDWSPHPSDPASGVKNSSVVVDTTGIYMDTTGNFNVKAGVNLSIRGGSGANSIGISNNHPDGYMQWAGQDDPDEAPYSVKKNGDIVASKIQIGNQNITGVSADKITEGTLDASLVTVSNLDADNITTGTLDANIITVSNLDADNITTGTLSATRIQAGSITGNHIAGETITGNNIVGLSITGEHIAGQTITGTNIAGETITGTNIVGGSITGTHIQTGSLTGDLLEGGTITGDLIYAGILEAKKIKADSIGADQINANHLAANSIETEHIKAGQVVADHILAGTITSEKLYSGEVEADKITSEYLYAGEVEAMKILAGNIGASQIQTNHIDAGAITGLHIQGNIIEGRHIIGETITGDKIQAETITGGHLGVETIQASNIATGSITADRLVVSAELDAYKISAEHIKTGGITADNIAANTITADSAIIENGAITTAKIGVAAIKEGNIDYLAVQSGHIADLAVTNAKIANLAVDGAKIASLAVDTGHIADAAIKTAQIDDAAIVSAKIADATIITANIADAAITNAKIDNLAVDSLKLANLAVTTAKIQNGAITNAKIDLLAVDTANIKDAAIVSAKIGEGEIRRANIGFAAIGSVEIEDGSIISAKIGEAQITNAHISTAGIDFAKINSVLIGEGMIDSGVIDTVHIKDGSITDALIGNLSANKIDAGTLSVQRLIFTGSEDSIIYQLNNIGDLESTNVSKLDGYVLEDNTVHADKIIARTISSEHIGANQINANHILAGSITVGKLGVGAVIADNIEAGQITVNHLAAGFGQSLNLESNQSIQTKVENMISGKADVTDLDGFATQEYVNTTYGTYFDQTEQAFSGQVSEVREYAESVNGNLNTYKEELSTWWRFDLNGLHIGELDSPFEVNLRGDAMEFKQDGKPIASITNHMLKIDSSQLTNQLVIGNDEEGYMTIDVVDEGLVCTWEAQRAT